LQDRGDYFYKTGNYKAAINAYTASLQVGRSVLPHCPDRSGAEPSRAERRCTRICACV
jgi:hypothetical protein